MGTKIFGIIASAAIVAVIALAVINYGNYRSLMPERHVEVVEPIEPTVEIDSLAVEQTDSLALVAPADTLRIEQ
ncbi:MAG: hypothetical protein IKY65_00090 [Rikenellaceae bacterium]|nr:hypothetical protein [Rikenellaceae bacterium]